jgi:hypothetical protein
MKDFEEFKPPIKFYGQRVSMSCENQDTDLFEMANLTPKQTGLPKGILYFSTQENNKRGSIKYYPVFPDRKEVLHISIPQLIILEDKNELTEYEKKQIVKFARINLMKFIYFWYNDAKLVDEPDVTEFKRRLKVNTSQLDDVSDIILKY